MGCAPRQSTALRAVLHSLRSLRPLRCDRLTPACLTEVRMVGKRMLYGEGPRSGLGRVVQDTAEARNAYLTRTPVLTYAWSGGQLFDNLRARKLARRPVKDDSGELRLDP